MSSSPFYSMLQSLDTICLLLHNFFATYLYRIVYITLHLHYYAPSLFYLFYCNLFTTVLSFSKPVAQISCFHVIFYNENHSSNSLQLFFSVKFHCPSFNNFLGTFPINTFRIFSIRSHCKTKIIPFLQCFVYGSHYNYNTLNPLKYRSTVQNFFLLPVICKTYIMYLSCFQSA
jgi:hypothetical protein